MKKAIILAVIFGLMFAFVDGSAKEKKEAKPKGAKPLIGVVVNLADLAKGGDGKMKKDEAVKLAESGSPVVFMVGTGKSAKIYFVYNSDGTFAGSKLAKYATVTKVGVEGTPKTVNGVNVINAVKISAME